MVLPIKNSEYWAWWILLLYTNMIPVRGSCYHVIIMDLLWFIIYHHKKKYGFIMVYYGLSSSLVSRIPWWIRPGFFDGSGESAPAPAQNSTRPSADQKTFLRLNRQAAGVLFLRVIQWIQTWDLIVV